MRILASVKDWLKFVTMASVIVQAFAASAISQVMIRDFTRPFVVLDTDGHNAPVRSLIFDGNDRLISGGMDKLLHTWNFGDGRPKLSSTIRPAIWNGPRGDIYAMAVAPRAKPGDESILAIGGYGLWSTQGNITLFRYPPNPAVPNGEVLAVLPSHIARDPNSPGHSETVMSLAFSPDGKLLASTSNDGRVILWDVATKLPKKNLKPPGSPLNAVAFRHDGQRLAAAGVDGIVRVWDVVSGNLVGQSPAPPDSNDPERFIVLCLSYTPDGRSLVAGNEGGNLLLYGADDLTKLRHLHQREEIRGAIDSLAISHDGKTLAAAVVSKVTPTGQLPRVDVVVELRSLIDGKKLPRSFPANNLVYALAFSPDDKTLAMAGGDRQAIQLHSVADPNRPTLTLQGRGESVWRVGFGDDSRTIGFSHAQEHVGPNVEYVGYQLKNQALAPVEGKTLNRALTAWNGWSVTPVDTYRLRVAGPNRTFDAVLDPTLDRRWWKWSFIPPTPSHPKPALAVACEAGVVFFRLEDGIRVRAFSGHSSPVYDLAPSPDGMWLATGSSDQTVRIWPLKGCDALPSLGATFRKRADGKPEVATVTERGFADGMGMKVGDVVEIAAVGPKALASLDNLQELEKTPPGTRVEFQVRRGANAVQVGTSRRDTPRMSLFVGADREWVLWTPEGYYETSVAGDRRYLGWHRNGPTLNQPTDHFPAETFEKELRRPDVLSALITNDNPAAAFALVLGQNPDPAAIVAAQAPPTVTVTTNVPRPVNAPVVAPQGGLNVRAIVAAEGRSLISSIRFLIDNREIAPPTTFTPPQNNADVSMQIPVHAGGQTVAVVAKNADGKERLVALDVASMVEAPKPPTLHVFTIGVGGPFRASKFPQIPQAALDAKDLRDFLAAPGGKKRFDRISDIPPLVNDQATGKTLREEFKSMSDSITDPNDVLFVVLESHLLTGQKDNFVIAADVSEQPTTAETPTGDEIAAQLVKVAQRGCKVILLLDTSHENAPKECRTGLTNFVRSVSKQGVITFTAANHGVSRPLSNGHGAFAQAILDVVKVRAISRPLVDPSKPMTLDDFQDIVINRVLELTKREQFVGYYPPDTINTSSPIFDPNQPSNLVQAK